MSMYLLSVMIGAASFDERSAELAPGVPVGGLRANGVAEVRDARFGRAIDVPGIGARADLNGSGPDARVEARIDPVHEPHLVAHLVHEPAREGASTQDEIRHHARVVGGVRALQARQRADHVHLRFSLHADHATLGRRGKGRPREARGRGIVRALCLSRGGGHRLIASRRPAPRSATWDV